MTRPRVVTNATFVALGVEPAAALSLADAETWRMRSSLRTGRGACDWGVEGTATVTRRVARGGPRPRSCQETGETGRGASAVTATAGARSGGGPHAPGFPPAAPWVVLSQRRELPSKPYVTARAAGPVAFKERSRK